MKTISVVNKVSIAIWLTAFIMLIIALALPQNSQAEPTPMHKMSDTTIVYPAYKAYDDLNSLTKDSDVVFEGEVLDDGTAVGGGLGKSSSADTIVPVTFYTVKVTGSVKGFSRLSDTAQIAVVGGVVDGRRFFLEDTPQVTKGQTYMLFGDGSGSTESAFAILAGGRAMARKVSNSEFVFPAVLGKFTAENSRISLSAFINAANK